MFPLQHSLLDRLRRIVIQHRYGKLGHDRSPVVFLIDDMDRHPGDPYPALQHRFMHPHPVHPLAAERGKERRVDIHDPAAPLPDRSLRDQFQVPGQDDQVRPGLIQQQVEPVVEVIAPGNPFRPHTNPAAPLESAGVLPVTGNQNGLRVKCSRPDGIQNRLEISAAARSEHRELQSHCHPFRSVHVGKERSVRGDSAPPVGQPRQQQALCEINTAGVRPVREIFAVV